MGKSLNAAENLMQILAHDENSLTLLLFSEANRLGKVPALLHAIRWRSHSRLPFGIKEVELHLQLGLSDFGRPDAVFVVTDLLDQLHLIIVEGKLASYRDACSDPLPGRQFDNSCNSMLNNQLALRYRAMRALPSLMTGVFLREQQHVAPSPYAMDALRSCQKASTLKLLRRVRERLTDFSLVTLTLDPEPPLVDLPATDPSFPLLFRQDTNAADDELKHLGSLTWDACAALFQDVENHFMHSYQLLLRQGGSIDEVGEDDDRFLVGRHIVLYKGKPYLFSGKGYSCKLHEWKVDHFEEFIKVTKNREEYNALRSEIRYIQAAPDVNMKDERAVWTELFRPLQIRGEGALPP